MSDHPDVDLSTQLTDLGGRLDQLRTVLDARLEAVDPWPLVFDGAAGVTELMDDIGRETALSYGLYNPAAAKAYIALFGGAASAAGGALEVPKESALVLPIHVTGQIRVGVDAGELGEGTARLWRLKFASPQPFFFGKL